MRDEQKIFDRLKSDYELLVSKGYEVVGVFLQGSQNYDLDYELSDIDTKAIVLPSFEEFVLNKKLVSYTIELEPSKEHVDVKDIRLMFENFKKQNINFVEILFTKYKYMNPKYENAFNKMFDIREQIARYDKYKTLNSVAGMSMEKFKAMEHPYPTLINKIEKFGYDPKQLHHILRLRDFIDKYVIDKPYYECMNATDRNYLVSVKRGGVYNLEEARVIGKNICDETYVIVKEWMNHNEKFIDEEVDAIMTNVLLEIFKLKFRDDLIK